MKSQRKPVHAVTQPGRLRPVVEDMAEMAAAAAAMHLGPRHAEGAVLGGGDGIVQRLVEARPAGAALELGLGGEQRQVAASAGEDALAMLLQKRARPGTFGAFLAQDFILLRRELRPPFGVGLLDFELFGSLRRRALEPTQGGEAEQAGDGSKHEAAVSHHRLLRKGRGPILRRELRASKRQSYTSQRQSFSHSCERRPVPTNLSALTLPALRKIGRAHV